MFDTFANPGSPFDPNANGSQLSYFDFDAQKGGPVFNVAQLEVTFEFVPDQPANGVLLVEAFNASGVASRLVNYKGQAGQQRIEPAAGEALHVGLDRGSPSSLRLRPPIELTPRTPPGSQRC